MILNAVLVGLVAAYGRIEQAWFGQQMIARPIWLCTLVGILLGDVTKGVMIGGTLELIWAGVVQIGAAPTEVVSGSVLASALVISNNLNAEEAITLAIPVALLASVLGTFITSLNSVLWSPVTNRAVERADKKTIWWTGISGGILYGLIYFVIIAIAFIAGNAAVNAVIEAIPMVIREGLTNASKLLPAIGIAILLKFTFDWKFIGFFVIGFLLPTYLKFGSMAVALTGVACALLYFYLKPKEVEDD